MGKASDSNAINTILPKSARSYAIISYALSLATVISPLKVVRYHLQRCSELGRKEKMLEGHGACSRMELLPNSQSANDGSPEKLPLL